MARAGSASRSPVAGEPLGARPACRSLLDPSDTGQAVKPGVQPLTSDLRDEGRGGLSSKGLEAADAAVVLDLAAVWGRDERVP